MSGLRIMVLAEDSDGQRERLEKEVTEEKSKNRMVACKCRHKV